jgi:hypothetical protein
MAMKDRALIATGAVGVVLAAICCAAPLLAVVLGAFGLTAWLAKAAYAVIPALLVCCLPVQSSAYYDRLPHVHTERPGTQVMSNCCAPQQRREDYDLAVDR